MIGKPLSFLEIIERLFEFWRNKNVIRLDGFDCPVGAGTWHPEVVKSSLLKFEYGIALVQLCKRPKDARKMLSKNRVYMHHQFQLLIAPIPPNMQKLVIQSLEACGIDTHTVSIDFDPGDWSSPSMGAFGKGYEIKCNNHEVGQYTYFQEMLGKKIKTTPPIEVAYGLERVAMIAQKVDSIAEIIWSYTEDGGKILWGEIFSESEKQEYDAKASEILETTISHMEKMCHSCMSFYPAYESFALMSHYFNILEAIGISYSKREVLMKKVRASGKRCAQLLTDTKSDVKEACHSYFLDAKEVLND